MDHNPNTQNSNQQNQKGNLPNSRSRFDNKRPDRNRRYGQDKNPNAEGNRVVKAQLGSKDKPNNQDRQKGRDDVKYSAKNKSADNISREPKHTDKAQFKKTYKSNQNNYSRYGRGRNTGHNEIFGRHINTKHIETVEDIQADIERIDKDIQFEIKQIKAVKLGL